MSEKMIKTIEQELKEKKLEQEKLKYDVDFCEKRKKLNNGEEIINDTNKRKDKIEKQIEEKNKEIEKIIQESSKLVFEKNNIPIQ